MADCSFFSEACWDVWGHAGLERLKMSWARERLGYLAYCGSELMTAGEREVRGDEGEWGGEEKAKECMGAANIYII